MLKSFSGFVLCAALLALMIFILPAAAVRADDQDYNAYWQDQAESQQQEQAEQQAQQQNYNAYWQEQAEQQTQPPA